METSNVLLVLLIVITSFGVAGIIFIGMAAAKIVRKVDLLGEWMDSVRPQVEASIGLFHGGMAEFKKASDLVTQIVGDVRGVTAAAREVTLPALQGIKSMTHAVQGLLSRAKSIFSAVGGMSANGNARKQRDQVDQAK